MSGAMRAMVPTPSSMRRCLGRRRARARDEPRAAARRQLADAIRALPLGQKQVVVLHLEDFDHAQIAATLGIGEGAVAVRLTRARQALAAMLTESRRTTTEEQA